MDERTPNEAAPVPVEDGEAAEGIRVEAEGASSPAKANEATPSTSTSSTLQHLVDRTLHFLAHASNETLSACLVGLGASTYLILGRVGLVLLGVAGGVVLHATWEGIRGDHRDEDAKKAEQARRREAGVEVARRVLNWRLNKATESNLEDLRVYTGQHLDFSSFEPETAKALDTFANATIKDYVYYWYGPTLPGEESFPATCKRTLTAFILSLSGHLRRKRPADAFLDFTTNASSILIVFLNELAVATNASPYSSAEDAIAAYLKSSPDSSLSYLLDESSQKRKLGDISEDILQAYLDPKSYNCPPVHTFLKEVLAQLVLGSTITLCSRPEWINEWIVYGLEESETTSKVMDIVDAGVEGRENAQAVNEIKEQFSPSQEIRSRKEVSSIAEPISAPHRRQSSKAEEAMDEAMREAKRLTQMIVEDEQRRASEPLEKQPTLNSSEDVSDAATQGAPTPTSSQSDREKQDEEVSEWTNDSTLAENPESATPSPSSPTKQFTSFDQLLANSQPTALAAKSEQYRQEPPQLTLHQAKISIFDDSQPGQRESVKAKPTIDYLVQIEPSNSVFTGWMISRKYADFETLHEVLRRISVITGVNGFAAAHATLPQWKGNTKSTLRADLERYLTDAVKYQPLAESEGMKRFLEKDRGLNKSPSSNKAFGWPTPDAFGKLGGDMVSVLTKAPKQVAGGVAGGGKVVFSGVAGLVSGGGKKPSQSQDSIAVPRISSIASMNGHRNNASVGQPFGTDTMAGSMSSTRQSQESLHFATSRPPFDRTFSTDTTASIDQKPIPPSSTSSLDLRRSIGSTTDLASPVTSQGPLSPASDRLPVHLKEDVINLPPPPSEMPEDYDSTINTTQANLGTVRSSVLNAEQSAPATPPRPPKPQAKPQQCLTEQEASVAVELMFAVVTELYTLSSAWNFRRTLLTAAKSFLLRPGNPQLQTIRDLLQSSLLDANLCDAGVSAHIYKLRENALPTEDELEQWKREYPEKTAVQKEELRIKARKLLTTKGMPQALTSVMGAAASGEALGKVFDCLQVESVSRGLIFGLMLQALRVVTH